MLKEHCNSYRHQLNHTPKQIYRCDFADCPREFVRQDLCNRHKERHTAKGSQLQRKDSMLNSVSPATESSKTLSMHGSTSPEMARSSMIGRSRTTQLQYPSPPENISSPFSSSTGQSTATFAGSAASSTVTDFNSSYQPVNTFKRSNSDHSLPAGQGTLNRTTFSTDRQQRRSFSVADAKPVDPLFPRPQLQSPVGQYGMLSSTSSNQSYQQNSAAQTSLQSPYVSQQNFTPFTLPPPGYPPLAPTPATPSSRENEINYNVSSPHAAVEYPNRDSGQSQQSGADMMLLDQMTVPSAMPVFGGEEYSRSPFAIPDDFVAYLGLFDGSSPLVHPGIGQHAYAG